MGSHPEYSTDLWAWETWWSYTGPPDQSEQKTAVDSLITLKFRFPSWRPQSTDFVLGPAQAQISTHSSHLFCLLETALSRCRTGNWGFAGVARTGRSIIFTTFSLINFNAAAQQTGAQPQVYMLQEYVEGSNWR